jgi:hypothetical protein
MEQSRNANSERDAQQQEPPNLYYSEEENQAGPDCEHSSHNAAADCDVVNRNAGMLLHDLSQV